MSASVGSGRLLVTVAAGEQALPGLRGGADGRVQGLLHSSRFRRHGRDLFVGEPVTDGARQQLAIVVIAAFTAVIGHLYSEHGHGGSRAWGIITAVEAAGAFLGAVIAARWCSARPVVACALLPATAAVPMVLMGLGAPWPVLAAVMLLPGICQTIYAVLWWTTVQRTFAPQVLARVNSWTVLGGFALTSAAVLAAGPLVSAIGAQQAAVGAALVVAAATIATLTVSGLRGTGGPGAQPVPEEQEMGVRQAAPAGSSSARL